MTGTSGYQIDFETPPAIGTEIAYGRGEVLTLRDVGAYRKSDGSDTTILEWTTSGGKVCTSGLRVKSVYWRSLAEAQSFAFDRAARCDQ